MKSKEVVRQELGNKTAQQFLKESLQVKDIEVVKKELNETKGKDEKETMQKRIGFLKSIIKDENYKEIKGEILRELAPLVEKVDKKTYTLIYDSLNEGIEPIYFWVLDFMADSKPTGLKLDVWKGKEEYEASASSGYFGEMGQRTSLMQQKAMEYLGAINNVIKSILNLIYDLREFEMRLKPYNDLKDPKGKTEDEKKENKQAGKFSLKGIWMDQVDARKGRGSINLLAQDLSFVTLRDAFFYVEDIEHINRLDLNERVKNILKRKLVEYQAWEENSELEIRKRYEVEKIYLRSQVGTLTLYANWAKPYLVAAQKLKMRNPTAETLKNPNIVDAFSNMELELKLLGKREIKPGDVHESYKDIKVKKKYFCIIEAKMKFRSLPSSVSGQGGRHYVHGGRTDIEFSAYGLDETELEALETKELYDDLYLIEDFVGVSLKKLIDDVKYFTSGPETKEEKPKPKKKQRLFGDIRQGFKDLYELLKEAVIPFEKKDAPDIIEEDMKATARKAAEGMTYLIYNQYKKQHGMLST